ncbi:MAG: ATP-binding protein [Syntrophomonadaceae bacterium]|nr:ATP-binding protein [Syntrophomonadaceae bacterium]
MNAELYKRLFRAIFSEDLDSLKKIADIIIEDERKKKHNKLANSLEKIAKQTSEIKNNNRVGKPFIHELSSLPVTRRDNMPLVSYIARQQLKHHMILPDILEQRLVRIEREFAARERLAKYSLSPRKKILLYGPPGCGKTLSAERLAWNIGLPLLKVRFDSLISSYFGESASNLRTVFDYCRREPVVLLLDECDFIAKSRIINQDVGEVPRIVNMLLMLLDEYDAPGLVIATTNLKVTLDKALFRRFDDIIELTLPTEYEIRELLKTTLSAINTDPDIEWGELAKRLEGHSHASVVAIAENSARNCVLEGLTTVKSMHLEKAVNEATMKY